MSTGMTSAIILLIATTLSAQDATITQTPSGDAARGRALVQSSKCFDCHRV